MDAVDEIKKRLGVEDVVGDYVELKRAGRNFKALSPFTHEKTPSLMISPDKQIWHDFSSNKGGDIFSFIQEVESVDFRGALEILARKAGIDLEMYSSGSGSSSKRKKEIIELHALAVVYYQHCLTKSGLALDYIRKKRQFSKETILTFGLGYSPNNGRALYDYLLKKGRTEKDLDGSG